MLSELYSRYNGFMMAVVFSSSPYEDQSRDVVHARRMRALLDEIGAPPVEIPDSHRDPDEQVSLAQELGGALHDIDETLYQSFLLGLSAWQASWVARKDAESLGKFVQNVERHAVECDVARTELLRFVRGIEHEDGQPLSFAKLLNPVYGLLNAYLGVAEPELDRFFVAMPFSAAFEDRYSIFYRPALNRYELEPIRAWSGFGSEEYLNSLQTLIGKCGGVFADASRDPATNTPNLNVLHEVGLAHGMEKLTYLVCDDDDSGSFPSNLAGLSMARFPRSGDQWPETALKNFHTLKLVIDAALYRQGEEREELEAAAQESPYPE